MRRAARWVAGVVLGSALLVFASAALAEDEYQRPEAFLAEVFAGDVPPPRLLWLAGEAREQVREILGHRYPGIRVRYWARNGRSAWILEEIGKYKPITAGFVVDRGRIERLKVLAYRESHGWEVRYPFFTDQFRDVRLRPDGGLSRGIDNISGATLSVDALTRLARLALYLHRRIAGAQ